MKSIQKIFTFLVILSVFSFKDASSEPNLKNSKVASQKKYQIVKLSGSGICHDKNSSSYSRTKDYTAFDSIAGCVGAGGRLPKSQTKQINEAINEATEQGNGFVTLYDRSNWPHW